MNTKRLPLTTFVFLFLMAFTVHQPVTGRQYEMSALDITVELQADGSMHVLEEREFVFKGRFSEVYRTFPLDDVASFDNFRVSVNGKEYHFSDSGEPGTLMLESYDDHKELRIFTEAEDTTKVFSISFEATGAVARYDDAALLYYQLISDQWEQPIHNIRARIHPPELLPEGHPRHWIHGSLEAESRFRDHGIVEVELDLLPPWHFLEVRALYPEAAFGAMPPYPGEIVDDVLDEVAVLTEEANRLREEALRREQERQERLERQAERHETGRVIAWPLALLVVVLWVWLFKKYRNKPELGEKPGAFSGLPDKEPPAMVNYLVNGTHVSGNALVSTLFDLAQRGYLKIEEKEKEKKSLFGQDKPEINFVVNRETLSQEGHALLSYEKKLVQFLFDDLAETPGEISLGRIRRKNTRMVKFFSSWSKAVKRLGKKKEWFDRRSFRGQYTGIIAHSFLAIVFLVLAIAFYGPWFLLPAGVSFLAVMGSFAIAHRTEEGEKAYQQWKYLRKHLKRYDFESDMKDLDAEKANAYLIYGLALGLGPGYVKRISKGIETHGYTSFFPWIILHHTSMSSFGDTVGKIITTTSSTMSSASGAGGGGTVGGGGGAASGGGGAR